MMGRISVSSTYVLIIPFLLPTKCWSRVLGEQDFFPLPQEEDIVATDEDGTTQNACPLDCKNGSDCTMGDQSVEGHGADPATGGPLDFHEELNRDGWSCRCPEGWTGLECGLSYESCNDGQHVCYHGGKCISGLEDVYGNEQLYCDCDDIIDPNQPTIRFAGKYCEEVVPGAIDGCDDEIETCKNGGVCKTNPVDPLNPCECQAGFHGKFCEYVEETVPDCSLECYNGGSCRLGVDEDAIGSKGIEYCECPPSFYGDQCESLPEACGEEYCYHGSKCFEILLADGSTEHLCDCANAYTEDRYYAGEFCQYPSTHFCTGTDDPNGRQFCTNGGRCPEERHRPCDCPPGFLGPRCAYQIGKDGGDYAQCKLDCQNGGTCQKGVKDLQTAYGKFASDVAYLLNETHQDYEHCTCPDGFFGIRCEYEYEQCKESEHRCYHGSTCVDVGGDTGCDCESSDTKTAGLFCEFFATQDCSEYPNDFSHEHRGFCTNDSTCYIDDEGSLKCRCTPGFEGTHCEFKKSKTTQKSTKNHDGVSLMAKIIGVLGLSVAAMYTAFLLFTGSKYQVEDVDQTNLREAGEAETKGGQQDQNTLKARGALSAVEIL